MAPASREQDEAIETDLVGFNLINRPLLNKGTAEGKKKSGGYLQAVGLRRVAREDQVTWIQDDGAKLKFESAQAHFATEALPQLSSHFFQQAEEEKGHALRFIKYVVDAGGRVVIPAIDAPKSKFKTPRDAVKLSLDQEIHVTQQINGLVELARKQNDYITINFLQWFLTEQLEEVSSMDNLLKITERAGNDLLQADEYLARVGVKAMPEPPAE